MPMVDINLEEVKEKPLLPAGQRIRFAIIKCDLQIAKNENKQTGQKEPYFACKMRVLNPEWQESGGYEVYHNWSTSPGALSSPDATFSVKKFFIVIGHQFGSKLSSEEFETIQFDGEIKYDDKFPNRPQLAKVLNG